MMSTCLSLSDDDLRLLFLDGNNCHIYFINIHSIHWFYLLDRCIYDEDSVARVLYAYEHGHQIESHTWSHANLTKLSFSQSQYLPTHLTQEPGSLFDLTQPYTPLLQFIMRCGWLNVSFMLSFLLTLYLSLPSFVLEALQRITGAYPAFMRPRTSFVDTI